MEVTPPPAETHSIPCPPCALRYKGIARAYVYNGANGYGHGGRRFDALQVGKNERKQTSRATTQPQAQTPLKTLYTASAVQFTQAAAPPHEKTVVVWHNNTAVGKQYKNAKLSAKHTKTQECTRKKACNAVQAGVL